MKPLAGKTAIITGAAAPRGIGRATALRLAEDGATVVLTDIAGLLKIDGAEIQKLDLLTELATEISNSGGQALALEVDVSKAADIETCVSTAQEHFGGIDILVNNAGTTIGTGAFLDSTCDEWQKSFQINLLGPMMFCQTVIPVFKTGGGGVIVNVGSTGSLGAEAGFGAYTAMKHGIVGLTKTIAAEFGDQNIRCNVVCPGYVMTDMHMAANTRIASERGVSIDEIKTERYAGVALQRAGAPEEIADAIAYLAGPASSYITGIALPISGGTPVGL